MKTRIGAVVVAALALALTATAARAGGMNLSWDDCGAFGVAQKNFACNRNQGANSLVVSATPDAPLPQLNGSFTTIFLQTDQPSLSNWWQMAPGGCRANAIVSDFYFVAGPYNCVDPWQGGAAGGLSYTPLWGGSNRARIRTVNAIAGSTPVDDQSELYLARIGIVNSKTVGTGACAGCTDGACLVLQSVQLFQPAGVGDHDIRNPILRQYVTWQPGGNSVPGGCPAATPTRTATWGSIKSLYR